MANRRKPTAEETATVPTQPTVTPESAEGAESEGNVELTVNDLGAIKQIIDIASSRGAFRPNEMVAIGTTYSRLETFLNVVAQQQQAQQAG